MSGKHSHITKQLIEAKDRQMVKYHYHRTLKDFGYRQWSQFDKHRLEGPDGNVCEIREIRKVPSSEYRTLSKYLGSWTKL